MALSGPDLWRGVIFAVFNIDGKVPVVADWLRSITEGTESWEFLLITMDDKTLMPEFLLSKDLISLANQR